MSPNFCKIIRKLRNQPYAPKWEQKEEKKNNLSYGQFPYVNKKYMETNQQLHINSGAHTFSYSVGEGAHFLVINRLGTKTDHSPPDSAGITML
jgi:hypothetical protein